MKIKQASQLTGVPASTIRYHEQQGLLPKANRTVNGYREYSEQDIEKIKLIKFCQSLGFNIKEISALTNEEQPKDHNAILANLDGKQAEIKEVLQQMTVKLSQINKLQSVLAKSWDEGKCLSPQQIKALIESVNI